MAGLPKLTVAHDICLLRHGETEWNKASRIQGQKDSALTELGQTQAKSQAQILRRLRPLLGDHQLWASPLGRAQQTAKFAFEGAPFETDARLSEIYCGRWEGLTKIERLERDPDFAASFDTEFDMYTNTPEGERIPELIDRLATFLTMLDAPAVIVSHKISLVIMRALLTGRDNAFHTRFAPRQGSVLQIGNSYEIVHI